MQPIPLEAIQHGSLWIYLLAIGLALMLLAVSLGVWEATREEKGKQLRIRLLIGAFVMMFGGLALGIVGVANGPQPFGDSVAQFEAQRAKAQSEIREHYGLKLSDWEIFELDYPAKAPRDDFKVYGSIEQREQIEGAKFTERTIYLVWADGELQLSESTDGKSFDELPSKS